MVVYIIACIDKGRGIGYHNRLLYHIGEDMTRFRLLTTGHTVLMGRKTYESLPNGALPHRRNLVVSRKNLILENCEVFTDIEKALQSCGSDEVVFVIGGESVYRQTMKYASKLYLTEVEDCMVADAFFPEFNHNEWKNYFLEEKEEKVGNDKKIIRYSFKIYDRCGK